MGSDMNKRILLFAGLLVALLLTIIAATAIGTASVPPALTLQIVMAKLGWPGGTEGLAEIPRATVSIIWNLRLPRVLLGALVGASLALAGVTYQGMLRNPLADPFTIGVSSGAAAGATSTPLSLLDA